MQVYLLAVVLFALLVAIFSIQNAVPVDIRFLTWHFQGISLVIVITGSLAAGAFFTFILGIARQARLGRELRYLRMRNRELNDDFSKQRSAFLDDTRPLPNARDRMPR